MKKIKNRQGILIVASFFIASLSNLVFYIEFLIRKIPPHELYSFDINLGIISFVVIISTVCYIKEWNN